HLPHSPTLHQLGFYTSCPWMPPFHPDHCLHRLLPTIVIFRWNGRQTEAIYISSIMAWSFRIQVNWIRITIFNECDIRMAKLKKLLTMPSGLGYRPTRPKLRMFSLIQILERPDYLWQMPMGVILCKCLCRVLLLRKLSMPRYSHPMGNPFSSACRARYS